MCNKNAMNHNEPFARTRMRSQLESGDNMSLVQSNEQTGDISCNKINENKSIFAVIKTMRENKVKSDILPLSLDS